MNLVNKIIFITGANGGLGTQLVKELLKQDVKKIYCVVRDIKNAKYLEELSKKISILEIDITDKNAVNNACKKIEKIDVLINNAGVNSGKRIFDNSTIDFDVNLNGTLNIIKFFENRIYKKGLIINITSILALCNYPIMSLYSISKSALHSLTQSLRAEMLLKNVKVLEVLPGPIDTNMTKGNDIPKASTNDIVNEIFHAIKNEINEVYPDEFSKMIKNSFDKDPRTLEEQFQKTLL